MLRSANLESRQSNRRERSYRFGDAPLREFGIKAKLRRRLLLPRLRCSAPRIWNQGKAVRDGLRRRHQMLRSANLESRQSISLRAAPFDQMLRSANLESRQSGEQLHLTSAEDAPLREFGIKAKLASVKLLPRRRCSAPRIWNQGKAETTYATKEFAMLRSANLESRQSQVIDAQSAEIDAPLREFGIKAKPVDGARIQEGRCSAPRIWNQGKASTRTVRLFGSMLRSANLESRQSIGDRRAVRSVDAPLREFGIKAKPRGELHKLEEGCSAPRIWNQGKARRESATACV